MEQSYGLLTSREETVPLKSIAVTLSINDFVTNVSATLNYKNEEKVPLEAFFVFPMDEDSAVYSFEALVDGKTIVAELQEKMKAHSNYEDALSQGYQAYLLEEDKYSRDVFSCNVGNLQPGAKVALTLKYVQELSLEADGALRYVLPAILNPRYQLSDQSGDSCLNMKTPIIPLEDLPYTLSMVATISSQHGIERVQSNCSLNPVEYLGQDKNSAQVSLAEGHKFDRDVELLIYYREVHSPSVSVEMGMPEMKPDSLMGAPSAMVSFYPDIPEVESFRSCGEFVFLMDRSGSMECPMSNEARSQLRIDAAKETLALLLKSLPIGCYFNIYGFGSSYDSFFPKSVLYTQETVQEAVERVKHLSADLGGTKILEPLQNIYKTPAIPGHPRQLFVFTDGEVSDTFSVIKEVKQNCKKHRLCKGILSELAVPGVESLPWSGILQERVFFIHIRCFSFGIGEGASTSLIKGIAQVSRGSSEFITGKDRMQTKALRSLKSALQSAVEDISLSWDLPPGLSAIVHSPEQTVIFRGQRLIIYAQLTGMMPQEESSGKVCLKYTLQGKSFEEKMTFSLQPKANTNFTIHRLAAKSLIQNKDLGCNETSERDREDVLNISIQSGVLSSFTAFVAINKELKEPVQGPLVQRDIPRPVLVGANSPCSGQLRMKSSYIACSAYLDTYADSECYDAFLVNEFPGSVQDMSLDCGLVQQSWGEVEETYSSNNKTNLKNYQKDTGENVVMQLISIQKANGSWDLDEDLAKVLGTNLGDIQAANPDKMKKLSIKRIDHVNERNEDSAVWATVLAVLWLHANGKDLKCEWELLERKAVAWLHDHSGSTVRMLVQAANTFLSLSVDPDVFRF